jgi:hypothetical protein
MNKAMHYRPGDRLIASDGTKYQIAQDGSLRRESPKGRSKRDRKRQRAALRRANRLLAKYATPLFMAAVYGEERGQRKAPQTVEGTTRPTGPSRQRRY